TPRPTRASRRRGEWGALGPRHDLRFRKSPAIRGTPGKIRRFGLAPERLQLAAYLFGALDERLERQHIGCCRWGRHRGDAGWIRGVGEEARNDRLRAGTGGSGER